MPTMKLKRTGTSRRSSPKGTTNPRKAAVASPEAITSHLLPAPSGPADAGTGHGAPKPIILTDRSGKRIVIGIHPDGSSVIGREGRGGPREEETPKGPLVLIGNSGRRIALGITPDGTPVIGRGRFPPKSELEKPTEVPPGQVRVVFEGTLGGDIPEQSLAGRSVKPEDVNPQVRRLDPRLFQPMVLRLEAETPDPPPPPPSAPANPKPFSTETLERMRRARRAR